MNFGQSPYSMPPVVKNLLIINVLFFLASFVFDRILGIRISDFLGLHVPLAQNFHIHQFVTYMFLHAYINFSTGSIILTHIFFNMFALFMFGRMLESVWGSKRFLMYYFFTGTGAGLINIIVAFIRIKSAEANIDPELVAMVYRDGADVLSQGKNYTDAALGQLNLLINTTTVGASGAVYGILLAFGMLFPNMPLYMIPFPFPIKAKYMVIGYGVLELYLGLANRPLDNVAHFAHLGGMLFGIFLIRYWRKTY